MKLYKNDRILFLGDSITDNFRNREDEKSLGLGFPLITSAFLAAEYPQATFTFYNRGIGGNQVEDILKRMDKDCLALKPDVLIFMIGINDTWHNEHGETFGSKQEAVRFEKAYRQFLEKVTQAGIKRVLLLEPYVLPYPEEERNAWRVDLDQKIQSVRALAKEFGCEFIPLDGIFAEKAILANPEYYAADGVHPTPAGDGVIAKEILSRCVYVDK